MPLELKNRKAPDASSGRGFSLGSVGLSAETAPTVSTVSSSQAYNCRGGATGTKEPVRQVHPPGITGIDPKKPQRRGQGSYTRLA
jgi:hypothetical protein